MKDVQSRLKQFMKYSGIPGTGLLTRAAARAARDARPGATRDGVSLDVPFVPSPNDVIDEMLAAARVGENDVLYDLGCGDGRVVITAALKTSLDFGVGIDLDPRRIARGRESARRLRLEGRVIFLTENFFDVDISNATIVTLYLLSSVNERLRPRLLRELRAGARIVSHDFDMGEWPPDRLIYVRGRAHKVLLWNVPANVSGKWHCTNDGTSCVVRLRQSYQTVAGTFISGTRALPIVEGRVSGESVEFRAIDVRTGRSFVFSGRVKGERIDGVMEHGGAWERWTAFRDPGTAGKIERPMREITVPAGGKR